MSEIADRIPGELIVASYSNTIRDRVVQRYTDATQRAALSPVPGTGELSYLTGSGDLQIYNGTAWVNFPDQVDFNALAARVLLLEEIKDSYRTFFDLGTIGLGTSLQNITATLVAPTNGLYLVELNTEAAVTTEGQNTLGGLTFGLNKGGVQQKAWGSFGVRHDDANDRPVEVEWVVQLQWTLDLIAGEGVNFTALRSNTFTTAGEVSERRISIRRVT